MSSCRNHVFAKIKKKNVFAKLVCNVSHYRNEPIDFERTVILHYRGKYGILFTLLELTGNQSETKFAVCCFGFHLPCRPLGQ